MSEENTQTEASAQNSKSDISPEEYTKAVERARSLEAESVHYKKELERFKNIDPDEHFALKDAVKQAEREQAKDPKEQEDIIRRQLSEEYAEKIQALESELGQQRKTNHELQVVDKALDKVADRFNSDTLPFIKGIIRESVDIDEQGNFLIKDAQGNQRLNGSAKPMTLDEFGQELAEKYPSMAKAQTAAGGKQAGQKVSGNGQSSTLPSGFDSWSKDQKTDWFRANPDFKPSGIRLG